MKRKPEWTSDSTFFDCESGLFLVHYSYDKHAFRVWERGVADSKWGDWQPIPEGLSEEEAKQYMETIWRMEG